jgi:sugar-specific transcriptional regulator TrmB
LLEIGTSTAQNISKRSGIGRSTTYFVLDELAKKGLVTFLDTKKVRTYNAENPAELLRYSRNAFQSMEASMPELERIWREAKGNGTSVRFFHGLNNIKRMYDDMLDLRWKHYWVFGSAEFWSKTDKQWFFEYMKRRADAGIKIKLLLEDSFEAREQQKIEKEVRGAEVKFIPKKFTKLKSLTSDVTILPDRIIYQNYGREMTSTVLHSKEGADLMRVWHEMVWELL